MSDATIVQSPIEYDPYDYETFCDPYPVFARLRRREVGEVQLLLGHLD